MKKNHKKKNINKAKIKGKKLIKNNQKITNKN